MEVTTFIILILAFLLQLLSFLKSDTSLFSFFKKISSLHDVDKETCQKLILELETHNQSINNKKT